MLNIFTEKNTYMVPSAAADAFAGMTEKKRGFSIIEVIVALSLFSVGILSVLPLYAQSIKFGRTNSDKLIASMLAQEGIELARNVRDNKWLEAGAPSFVDSFVPTFNTDGVVKYFVCKQESGACTELNLATDLDDAFTEPDTKLYINATKNYDSVNTGTDSGFSRVVQVTAKEDAGNVGNIYYAVKSVVRWKVNNAAHEYIASTELYDWR